MMALRLRVLPTQCPVDLFGLGVSMSLILIIPAEAQLRLAAPWAVAIAESMDCEIIPVVLGADHEILDRHTEATFAKLLHGSPSNSIANGHAPASVTTSATPATVAPSPATSAKSATSATKASSAPARDSAAGDSAGNSPAPLRSPVTVVNLEQDVEPIHQLCQERGCRLLLIPYSHADADWQLKLFQKSKYRTVWLNPCSPPPTKAAEIAGGYRLTELVTKRITMKMLGLQPTAWGIDHQKPDHVDDDKQVELAIHAFDQLAADGKSLIVLASNDENGWLSKAGQAALDEDCGSSFAMVREGQSMARGALARLRRWTDSITPPLSRSERVELQEDLETGSRPSFEFLGLISAASMLAAFGLYQNSAAVIIGAMLIAPLMTPILGAGMAIAVGNRPLFRTAWKAIGLGFVGALVSGACFGVLVLVLRGFSWPDLGPEKATEMWARCNPSPIDFCVGFVGGMAASYARTRKDLSSALAGAAIAAALVPPISTAGLQLVFGPWNLQAHGLPILGPIIVVGINVLTIMAGSSLVLWVRGIRATDGQRKKQDRWAIRTILAVLVAILLVLVGLLEAKLLTGG